MKKNIIAIGLVIFIGFGIYMINRSQAYVKEEVPVQTSIQDVVEASVFNTPDENVEPTPPKELNLEAPFYSQAPFANWDYPWQEACEEASVLLVANAYYNHEWNTSEFNEQILALVEWEKRMFGSYEHTDVEQTAQILEEYLYLDVVIHENPTFEDIKSILARGHLIVMTFAGKELGNPFYSNGGPNYHAMMIKGYKEDNKVIVHDVGTRRGEDYVYTWNVIENSLHDYAEPIQNGAKRYIEVHPVKL